MGMVLKIAAGVLIGLLGYQAIIYQKIDNQNIEYQKQMAIQQASYENHRENIRVTQALGRNYKLLTNAIAAYYRKNKALPKFISDLKCAGTHSHSGKSACAVVSEDGVFYANNDDEWVSVEPYVLDGKLYNRCKSSVSLSMGSSLNQDCKPLSASDIPEKKHPPFDCNVAEGDTEKIICTSDKLIANEIKLSLTYKTLLRQNPVDRKQQIIDDQNNFMNTRRKTCVTSACIDEMTSKKILRLEFLGVWKKKE